MDRFGNRQVSSSQGDIDATLTALEKVDQQLDCQVVDHADGTYEVKYMASFRGRYLVAVQLNKAHIKGSPFDLAVEAGDVSAHHSFVEPPRIVHEGGTTNVAFEVVLKDSFGNVRGVGGDTVVVEVQGPGAPQAHLRDREDGSYEARFSTTLSGTFQLQVFVNGLAICEKIPVVVAAGAAFAPLCHMDESSPLQAAKAGQTVEFRIVSTDMRGARLRVGGAKFSISASQAMSVTNTRTLSNVGAAPRREDRGKKKPGSESGASPPAKKGGVEPATTASRSSEIACSLKDLKDGTYLASCTAAVAGTHRISITLDGLPISGSPFLWVVAPSVGTLQLQVPRAAIAGEPMSLLIEQFDEFTNQVSTLPSDVLCSMQRLDDGSMVPVVLRETRTGLQLTCTCIRAANYALSLSHRGAVVSGSPFMIEVIPTECSPAHCTIANIPDGPVPVSKLLDSIKIISKDRFGNVRAVLVDRSDVFEVRLFGPSDCRAKVLALGGGEYQIQCTTEVNGTYQVYVMHNGAPLAGCPFQLSAVAALPDPSNSVICAPVESTVTSGQPFGLVVKCRDRAGNDCMRSGAGLTSLLTS
jgi:hypothetical protein